MSWNVFHPYITFSFIIRQSLLSPWTEQVFQLLPNASVPDVSHMSVRRELIQKQFVIIKSG